MDLSEAFSDVEVVSDGLPEPPGEAFQADLLAAFSDGDEEVSAAHDVLDLAVPAGAVSVVAKEQGTAATETSRCAGECLKGKLGKGRHGGQLERNMICAHMRLRSGTRSLDRQKTSCLLRWGIVSWLRTASASVLQPSQHVQEAFESS